ncbi:MAG TPA: hypothetical protein VK563_00235 [Puia sp.]|nr:hypothetical protein [Puia sp.]
MLYNVYKNISDEEFNFVYDKLSKLKTKILSVFCDDLLSSDRTDAVDYLALSFLFADSGPFQGDLAILFLDKPGIVKFNVGLIKTLDEDGVRYYKREIVAKDLVFEILERHILEYISRGIDTWRSWTEEEIRKSEKTVISVKENGGNGQ